MAEGPGTALNGILQSWNGKMPERTCVPHWAGILFLVLLSFTVYFDSFYVPFCWDDDNLILEDEHVRSLKNIPEFFDLDYWKKEAPFRGANFRPLRTVSFALDYFVWGHNPFGYHVTNLFFHIVNVLLIYFLVRFLFPSDKPGGRFLPIVSAAFFATHPVHTETVVWIKNRSELFSTFFFLTSLILFIRSRKIACPQPASKYVLSLVCFVLALFSKEMAITLPLILVMYSLLFLFPHDHPSLEKGKRILLGTLPFWVIGALYADLRFTLLNLWSPGPVARVEISSRILLVIRTVGEYVMLLAFPVNLSAERPFNVPKTLWEPEMLVFGAAAMISVAIGALVVYRARRSSPLLAFSLLWIGFTLLPTANIYYLSSRPLAEQRLYLPSVGFCILLSLIIVKAVEFLQGTEKTSSWVSGIRLTDTFSVPRLFAVAAVSGMMVFYSAGTIRRTADWKDPVKFWEKTAQSNPGYWRPHVNLGLAYMYENRLDEAVVRFKHALALAPDAPGTYFDLGFAYEIQGKTGEATAMFEKGMSLASGKADLRPHLRTVMPRISETDLYNTKYVLGRFYQRRGYEEQAVKYYEMALAENPAHAETHYSLGQLYERERKFSEAIFHYQKVIESEPRHREIAQVYLSLARIYRLRGQSDKAMTFWKKAGELATDNFEMRRNLAEIFKDAGMVPEAIEQYKKAAAIAPKDWDVFFNLGSLYARQGLSLEAVEYFEKAVKNNPNFAEAHYQLGLLYIDSRRFPDAAKMFQRVMYLDPTNRTARKLYERANISADKQGHDP